MSEVSVVAVRAPASNDASPIRVVIVREPAPIKGRVAAAVLFALLVRQRARCDL